MRDLSQLIIYEEHIFTVGEDTYIDSVTESNNAVVFEDNEETGYFYAVDNTNKVKILDALHIYNVDDVIDKDKPSTIKILWSMDMTLAFLSINNYYHAVFDFQNKAGYCRNGFPKSYGDWALVSERKMTDELLISFK